MFIKGISSTLSEKYLYIEIVILYSLVMFQNRWDLRKLFVLDILAFPRFYLHESGLDLTAPGPEAAQTTSPDTLVLSMREGVKRHTSGRIPIHQIGRGGSQLRLPFASAPIRAIAFAPRLQDLSDP